MLVKQGFRAVYNRISQVIENTVANTIIVTCAQHTMGKLGVIPSRLKQLSCTLIGCIFYPHGVNTHIAYKLRKLTPTEIRDLET